MSALNRFGEPHHKPGRPKGATTRRESLAQLIARLKSWQQELDTNRHGYAHLAPDAIAHLTAEIAAKRFRGQRAQQPEGGQG